MKQTPEQLWQEMADMTKARCKESPGCHGEGWCCNAMYCEEVRQYAAKKGVTLTEPSPRNEQLPFCGENGCTVPPQYRPLCTVHQCRIETAPADWQRKYFKLREKLNILLSEENI